MSFDNRLRLSNALAASETTVPEDIIQYPSMMSVGEKALLYALARDYFTGEGRIVDAGIFLGASTYVFARGIADNELPLDQPPYIDSYDIGIWVRSMNKYLERPAVKRALKGIDNPKVGQTFIPILNRLLGQYRQQTNLNIGDIEVTGIARGPVEIAFYDCLKTYSRDKSVFFAFAPHYIPEKTVVIQQDYFFYGAPDHKIRQEYYSDHYEYMGGRKDSAVFRVVKAFDQLDRNEDPIDKLSLDQKLALVEQAANRADTPESIATTLMSGVDLLQEANQFDLASRYLDRVIADHGDHLTANTQGVADRLRETISEKLSA